MLALIPSSTDCSIPQLSPLVSEKTMLDINYYLGLELELNNFRIYIPVAAWLQTPTHHKLSCSSPSQRRPIGAKRSGLEILSTHIISHHLWVAALVRVVPMFSTASLSSERRTSSASLIWTVLVPPCPEKSDTHTQQSLLELLPSHELLFHPAPSPDHVET